MAVLLMQAVPAYCQQVTLTQTSELVGIINQSASYTVGSTVTTVTASMESGAYRFTHWILNGVRTNDYLGCALNPVRTPIYVDTVAVANYTNTTADSDADGVGDWYESYHLGTLANTGTSDGDGDGYTLSEEYRRDYQPLIKDRIVAGGISRRQTALLAVKITDKAYAFTSDPVGLVMQSGLVASGTVVQTQSLQGDNGAYAFGYWTVNGVRQADRLGRALSQLTFTVTNDIAAVAHYFGKTDDTDTDGLPDWWEWLNYGGLTYDGTSDTDGDGYTLAEEYRRDYEPLIKDRIVAGGVSRRQSVLISVRITAKQYTFTSDPAGLVNQSGLVEIGTVVQTQNLQGDNGAYTFGYWTVDGVRQVDRLGRSLSQLSFTVTNDIAAVAHYFGKTVDTDADGLPDWWEWLNFGSLTYGGTDDPDGDGYTLAEEYRRDYEPLIKDRLVAGGISRRQSAQILYVRPSPQLTVISAYGGAVPPQGTYLYDWESAVICQITNSPIPAGLTQYVCRGWSGSGSVPASGATTNTGPIILQGNSGITWVWATQYRLDTEAAGGGSVDQPDQWADAGSNVTVTATASNLYYFAGWTGDTQGDTNALAMTVTMDRPRQLQAHFKDAYQLSTNIGPYAGGNTITITNGNFGNITNVLVGGVRATIQNSGANWVTITIPSIDSAGVKDIIIQTDIGATTLTGAYAVNPAGEIGILDWSRWQEVTGLPAARHALAAGVLNGALFAVGGSAGGSSYRTNAYRYNGTNWTEVAGLPAARYGLAAGALNGGLYAVGGDGATNVYRYDGTTWAEVKGLPAARYGLAAGELNGALYAVGGTLTGSASATNVYRYNGTNWTEVAGLPARRGWLAAGVLNGALYAVGGWISGGSTFETNVYRYNGTNWTEVAGLPARRGHLAAGVLNGALYAVGGHTGSAIATNVYRYDGTNWTEVAGLPAERYVLAAGVLNGTLYAVGGAGNAGAATNMYRYPAVAGSGVSPSSGSWTGCYSVVISGNNLGNGSDITNVTLCGVSATILAGQSATQVVVVAGAGGPGLGDVRVFSTSFGETVRSNAFTYLRENESPLVFSPTTPQFYGTTNTLSVSGGSGTGAVSYAVLSGPGVIVGETQLTVTNGTGTIWVRATKAQDDFYYAVSVTSSVEAAKAGQVISFAVISDQLTTNKVGLAATGSSGLLTSFSVVSGLASISGDTNLSFTGIGSVSIAASQTGNGNYNAAPTVTNTFNVTKATAGVTLNNFSQTYDGTPRVVTATTDPPGLTVDMTYNGSTSSPQAAGSYAVTGTVNNVMYQGNQTGTLVIVRGLDTITFGNTNQVYDGTAKTVTVVSVQGQTVTVSYDGSASSPQVAGSYAVTGVVDAANWEATNTTTLTIGKADQTITFLNIALQKQSATVGLSATANSGLAVTFSANPPGSISGLTNLTFTGVGDVEVVASQAGNGNWNAAPDVTNIVKVFTVTPDNGPYAGGNFVTVSNGHLGSITNVLVGGVQASIQDSGANWVTIMIPAIGSEGVRDVVIQTDIGIITLAGAYTVNPVGMIIGQDWSRWQEVAGLPAPRFGLAAGVLNGELYAVGGHISGTSARTNVYRYNGTTWTEVAGLPAARAFQALGVLNGALYAAAGDSGSGFADTVSRYNGTNWAGVAGLSATRQCMAGGVLNGALYVIGGMNSSYTILTNVDYYNGTNWAGVAGLPVALYGTAVAELNGALYAVGGHDGSIVRTNVYLYNGTNWTEVAGLPTASHVKAVGVLNGALYAFGGQAAAAQTNVYRYNGTNWTEVAGLPAARGYLAGGVRNGALYAIAGYDSGSSKTNVYRYPAVAGSGVSPFSGSWTGGYTVVISGYNLGNGGDITNVTLCGASATILPGQSASQVVVTAGSSAAIGLGDVRVFSTSFGETVQSNSFTYLRESQGPLVFTPTTPQTYGTTNALSVSGGSGTAAVSYTVLSGPGLIMAGTQLTVTNGTGTISVRATKAQDDFFYAASVTSFVAAAKADQAIGNFLPTNGSVFVETNMVELSATASSGLPVGFATNSGPALITDGTNLSFIGVGSVSIVASQDGNGNYNAAPVVTNTFSVLALFDLTIQSEHGTTRPATGTYTYITGAVLTNTVDDPGASDTTQYLCTGWAMAGNDPTGGAGRSVVMTLTNDATLTWQWKSQYWLDTEATVGGRVDPSDQWVDAGSNVTVTAMVSNLYCFAGWTGDTQGDTNALAMTVTMDRPRQLQANFELEPTRIIGVIGNLAFGNATTGTTATATLTITNSGNATLSVSSISYPSGFSGAWSGTLGSGTATNVTVSFSPVALTLYSGTVTVNSDATSGGNTISATGTGTSVLTGAKAMTGFTITTSHSGTLVNGPVWTSGKYGNGLSLSNGKYVTVPTPTPDIYNIAGALTIAMWVKPNSVTCSGADPAYALISKRSSNHASPYDLCILNGGSIEFQYWGTSIQWPTFFSSGTLTTGAWQHVAVTRSFSGTSATITFYINGVASGCSTSDTGQAKGSSDPVWISRDGYHTRYTSEGSYNGSIDEVQIYNRGLSALEISQICSNNASAITNRVGNWSLDEDSGATASDTLAEGAVNEAAKTVAVKVPVGTDVTALVPRITVSPLATVAPLSGVTQNFSSPVTYMVTAENLTTQSYTVTVSVIDLHTLTVASAHAGTDPGTVTADYNTELSQFITNSPLAGGEGTQYVCTAAAVVGNAFRQVSPTNVTLTLTNNSTLTWLWGTNVQFSRTAGPNGGVTGDTDGWYAIGGSITVTAVPALYYHFDCWSGDVPAGQTNSNPLALCMDRDRAITACFAPNMATNDTPHWWLALHELSTNDAGTVYEDGDGMPAWQEYIAGTDPTNPASYLRLTDAQGAAGQGLIVRWSSVSNRFYDLSRATNLLSGTNAFTILQRARDLPATPTENVYTDSVEGIGPYFYRIGVHE